LLDNKQAQAQVKTWEDALEETIATYEQQCNEQLQKPMKIKIDFASFDWSKQLFEWFSSGAIFEYFINAFKHIFSVPETQQQLKTVNTLLITMRKLASQKTAIDTAGVLKVFVDLQTTYSLVSDSTDGTITASYISETDLKQLLDKTQNSVMQRLLLENPAHMKQMEWLSYLLIPVLSFNKRQSTPTTAINAQQAIYIEWSITDNESLSLMNVNQPQELEQIVSLYITNAINPSLERLLASIEGLHASDSRCFELFKSIFNGIALCIDAKMIKNNEEPTIRIKSKHTGVGDIILYRPKEQDLTVELLIDHTLSNIVQHLQDCIATTCAKLEAEIQETHKVKLIISVLWNQFQKVCLDDEFALVDSLTFLNHNLYTRVKQFIDNTESNQFIMYFTRLQITCIPDNTVAPAVEPQQAVDTSITSTSVDDIHNRTMDSVDGTSADPIYFAGTIIQRNVLYDCIVRHGNIHVEAEEDKSANEEVGSESKCFSFYTPALETFVSSWIQTHPNPAEDINIPTNALFDISIINEMFGLDAQAKIMKQVMETSPLLSSQFTQSDLEQVVESGLLHLHDLIVQFQEQRQDFSNTIAIDVMPVFVTNFCDMIGISAQQVAENSIIQAVKSACTAVTGQDQEANATTLSFDKIAMAILVAVLPMVMQTYLDNCRNIFMFGLQSAGKTKLLQFMKLNESVVTVPSIGIAKETIQVKNLHVSIHVVGGNAYSRQSWKYYVKKSEKIPKIDAVVFVMDAHELDDIKVVECQKLMKKFVKFSCKLNKKLAKKQQLLAAAEQLSPTKEYHEEAFTSSEYASTPPNDQTPMSAPSSTDQQQEVEGVAKLPLLVLANKIDKSGNVEEAKKAFEATYGEWLQQKIIKRFASAFLLKYTSAVTGEGIEEAKSWLYKQL